MTNTVVEKFHGPIVNWKSPADVRIIRVILTKNLSNTPGAGPAVNSAHFIDTYGNGYSQGINTSGNLGTGNVTSVSSPTLILGGLALTKIARMGASGGSTVLALANTGRAYGFGTNNTGALGVGDVTPRSSPVAVLGGLFFQDLINDNQSSFGLTNTGVLYGWGGNPSGILGNGNTAARSSPVAVLGGITFSSMIMMNNATAIGIDTIGQAWGWGQNQFGEAGIGNTTPQSSPVAVAGAVPFFVKMIEGKNCVYAIGTGNATGSDGTIGNTLYAMGSNGAGRLGVGDNTSRSSPVAVLGNLLVDPNNVSASNTGTSAVVFLDVKGVAYAFGENSAGELGVGDTNARSSPVAVLGGNVFRKIVTNNQSSYGITDNGTLKAWGINNSGQLGVGDVASRSSPVAVLSGQFFVDVFIGNTNVYGIGSDGLLYAWGLNNNGSLGLGDTTPRSSPVAVVGGLLFRSGATVVMQTIFVTPNTIYQLNLRQNNAVVGPYLIGQGYFDTMYLVYDK